jgi:hybrid polyketide synthase/nonribosomal peptide synthetase FtdB
MEESKMEPIAIVGIGCRFPGGANNPESFWKLLQEGIDATTDIPKDRWDIQTFYDPDKSKPGKAYTCHGGFLEKVDEFDAQFFGISPREAAYMDPQQRILLEIVWEALEDAGIIPEKITGSNTGVYIGAFTLDYKILQLNSGSLEQIDTHTATGAMMTMVSNRISHIFDLRGPSLSVDTACSGSLVAVHLACQSIWNNQCSMAIAGGVNVITTPEYTIAESKGGFLSPEGRCKTFDTGADGYARGEGAGVVILKPLSQAIADNDFVYAVIRGTGVNQDGHTNGITVPRGESQENLMKEVYRNAGISPRQIRYIEAHGTGTPTGDPIEAKAIANAVAADLPPGEKCIVGSVKTNIGHLEAASGAAGLIKSVLILQNKQIPAHLHLRNINPQIPIDRLRIPTSMEPLPEKSEPAIIGVNSFGFGGTNAHVVIEEAPAQKHIKQAITNKTHRNWPGMLPLSARNKNALQDLAREYKELLAGDSITGDQLTDIQYSAAKRRTHHEHRLAISAYTKEEFIQKLDAFLAGENQMGVSVGRAVANKYQKLVFVYTGMGPIWWAMGRQLIEREPVFKQIITKCDELIRKYANWSLFEELTADETNSRLDQPQFAQPANFAIQIGLTELWRAWGVVPDAVVGHSVGEVSAVYAAGVLSLEDAVWLSVERGRAQQTAVDKGSMLAVGLSRDEATQLINDLGNDRVSIAAINSPKSVTLAGDITELEKIQAKLQEQDILARFLKVNVAYHSVQMDSLRDGLLESLQKISPKPASIPIYSTVSGKQMVGPEFNNDYWWRNVRQPVDFEQAMNQIIQSGYNLFVEVGPHPALAASISECLASTGSDGKILASIQRKKDEFMTMSEALGTLYTLGYPVDWEQIHPGQYQYVKLPTYPWQRERHWIETEESTQKRLGKREHPLLGRRLPTPQPTWENELNLHYYHYLRDHRLQDAEVFPGAGYVEMGLACAQRVYGEHTVSLEEVKFTNALFLSQGSPKVRLVFDSREGNFTVFSQTQNGGNDWTSHATGRISRNYNWIQPPKVNIDEVLMRCPDEYPQTDCYQDFRTKGFQYGPYFQGVQKIWVGPREVLGRISFSGITDLGEADYIFHPAILDACIQIMIMKIPPDFLPVRIERFNVYRRPESTLWSYAFIKEMTDQRLYGDIKLLDDEGNIIAEMIGIHAQSMYNAGGYHADNINEWFYELQWQLKMNSAGDEIAASAKSDNHQPGTWIIFSDIHGIGRRLATRLEQQGERTIIVLPGENYQFTEASGQCILNPSSLEDHILLVNEIAGKDCPAVRGIVHMWATDAVDEREVTDDVLEKYRTLGCFAITTLAKALEILGVTTKLWLITRGCQMIDENTSPAAILQTQVWGLGRVIGHQEMPSRWGGLIDLDPSSAPEEIQALFTEVYQPDGEDQIVFRAGERFTARLANKAIPSSKAPIRFRTDGSYLITGGFGALGVLISKWMVENGARRLIMMSRAKFPPRSEWGHIAQDSSFAEQIAVIRGLEAKGATIHLAPVDVGNRAQLAAYIQSYRDEGWPPILGVIHSAGVVRDQLLQQMDFETYNLVLRPKVSGAWNLHSVFADMPLDFFILFSSTASLMGAMGQINYASGNAYLDGLARYRSAHGLPALSINWGPWAEVGMASKLNLLDFYHQKGIDAIYPHQGLEVMNRLFGQDSPQVAVIPVTWSLACKNYFMGKVPAMVAELGLQNSGREAAAGNEDSLSETNNGPLQKVLACAPEDRLSTVEDCLQELVAGVLRFDRSKLDIHDSLSALGLDSMMATEMRNKIELGFEIMIPIVDLLQGLSVAELAVKVLVKLNDARKFADVPVSAVSIQELAGQTGDDLVAELLEEIDGLSDQEIQKLLDSEEEIPVKI